MSQAPRYRIVDCWWPVTDRNGEFVADNYPFFVDQGIFLVGEDRMLWERVGGPFDTLTQAELWISGGATKIVGYYDARGVKLKETA